MVGPLPDEMRYPFARWYHRAVMRCLPRRQALWYAMHVNVADGPRSFWYWNGPAAQTIARRLATLNGGEHG